MGEWTIQEAICTDCKKDCDYDLKCEENLKKELCFCAWCYDEYDGIVVSLCLYHMRKAFEELGKQLILESPAYSNFAEAAAEIIKERLK